MAYMNKSTIIATCLLNTGIVSRLEDGEHIVRTTFQDIRPDRSFAQWNTLIPDNIARTIITNVGRPKDIPVDLFITKLD